MKSKHKGEYRWHDDDCRCKSAGIEYCNRHGSIWSCCGQTAREAPCVRGVWPLPVVEERTFRPAPPSRRLPKPPSWYWSGRLPGGRRRRRYVFFTDGLEFTIPGQPRGRDDVIAERPELVDFLSEQWDLVTGVAPCIYRYVNGQKTEAELRRRLEAASLPPGSTE